MTVNIPSFLTIARDESGQKATLSVQDTEIPHQRAMWGMSIS
jgi:large subunit ribosomal protein L6